MPFFEKGELKYYQFDIFPGSVLNAVFTRRGGVSPQPWNSLNLGGSVGDDPQNVAVNRVRVFESMGRPPASIHDVWLVHGVDVVHARAARPLEEHPTRADIIFTDNPEVSLFMRFADCVPLLFHDPKKGVIGIAHAGWMGTLQGVAGTAIRSMQAQYGSNPADVTVGIGPSIGVDHYEVGAEVFDKFNESHSATVEQIFQRRDGRLYLDLWTANALQLREAGVEYIQICGLCTACSLSDWYSHRAEKGKTGRFGALMALA